MKKKLDVKRVVLYLILLLFLIFYIIPVYTTLTTSLKDLGEVATSSPIKLPHKIYLGAYRDAAAELKRPFLNSLAFAIPATFISCVLGSINGYIFSKYKFKGSELIFLLFLIGIFLPYQSILIPLFEIISSLGLYDTFWALILTHSAYGIPITTLLFRNYYDQIPNELIEAGKVDGYGISGIYSKIILPLSGPAFAMTIIFQFTNVWNDYLFGLVLTMSANVRPMTVALANLKGSFAAAWNIQMAGALLVTLPTILLFIFLGKYFVRGLLAGSVKG